MKYLLRSVLALAMVLSTYSCDVQDIKEDMVHFDQAFIPVWTYAYEGNTQKAKAAVFYLEFRWQRLYGKYRDAVPEEAWQESFRRVNEWLGDVYYAIDADESQLALSQLEHVRYELQQLRRRYHVDYHLDHLYDFQDELAILIEAANDERLCMMEWAEFEELSVAALQQWRGVMVRDFDAGFYGLDAEEERLYYAYILEMEEALRSFADIVESADREAIAAESAHLESAFVPLLRLFGNFKASATYYARHQP